ncbi:MAG: site-specific integrase [Clostridia bacterium]|nr:site-specific integrase [Clostridia bacterium]
MSEKRRDSKGRILRDGESQRKDGRYEYRYTDKNGNRHSIYSWKLVETDKLPDGRKKCVSLREQIKKIEADAYDGIDVYDTRGATVDMCFERYIGLAKGIKENTRQTYMSLYNKHIRPVLGNRKIADVRYSDVQKFYQDLLYDGDLKINTVESINGVLTPVFSLAVKDMLIRSSPTKGAFRQVKKQSGLKQEKRKPLSVREQDIFLRYISNTPKYRKWYSLFCFLFGTGCRIGEALALQWDDCDFDDHMIHVRHTLARYKNSDGIPEKHIGTPKTDCGVRSIPMRPDVKAALMETLRMRIDENIISQEIDGYSNFVFVGIRGNALDVSTVEAAMKSIVKTYNKTEEYMAEREKREPVYLPVFTPHIIRHTFCTRLCEADVNLKVIQEIMGHNDITTTMNIYTDVSSEYKKTAFENDGMNMIFQSGSEYA